jgi:hypothetical protein
MMHGFHLIWGFISCAGLHHHTGLSEKCVSVASLQKAGYKKKKDPQQDPSI